MKKVILKKLSTYLPLAFFYSVIVVMILLMNARFANLEQTKSANESTVQIAQTK